MNKVNELIKEMEEKVNGILNEYSKKIEEEIEKQAKWDMLKGLEL